jgi:hypothetical protein
VAVKVPTMADGLTGGGLGEGGTTWGRGSVGPRRLRRRAWVEACGMGAAAKSGNTRRYATDINFFNFHIDFLNYRGTVWSMKFIPSNIGCPNCQGAMVPVVVRCEACALEVKGSFRLNEFATLSPEDLHFLRIFVHCEGRIREMESALGVSYPTIKARLAKLKQALGETAGEEGIAPETSSMSAGKDLHHSSAAPADAARQEIKAEAAEVLRDLEAGRVSFGEAMKRIRGESREGGAV